MRPKEPARQLTFDLAGDPCFGIEDFFVSESNENAYAMLELWPDWPDSVLLLRGPAGAGKSHLGAIWAARAGARILTARDFAAERDLESLARSGPLLIEDADAIGEAEASLFHLLNLVRHHHHALVLTARRAPDFWGLRIADLLSRLRLAPVAAIEPPDEDLMRAILVKLFLDRQLVVDTGLIEHAALHLDRSFEAARDFVERLDREALARGARITKSLAGTVLQSLIPPETE
ncbi:Chromosomal replication initiator DnaA [Beijerinckia indica subsp. indica ATCC 9039]|uniref:Chromosomal replication initiator DnaA n=2 Tax=Beijerinckia TaxID=532 RepID=B2IJR7_BEII9|nr:Chromosomal replication initiator DnaA [Beijerinckia indica subsp. indica ATCC 9039]